MRSKEQQLHLQLTSLAAHYVPPQQKRGGAVGSGSAVVGVPLPQHTTSQKDTHMTPSHDPEPHGSRDTFVPPPVKVKSDIELLKEKLISTDAITEIDIGGCPPVKYVKYTDEEMTEAHDPDLDMPNDTTTEAEQIAEQERLYKLYNPTDEQKLSDITVKTNPPIVHQHNDQWYFWEETYSQRIGPYSTEIAANKALDHYCDVVLGQGRDPS